jgi:hypothetical protein
MSANTLPCVNQNTNCGGNTNCDSFCESSNHICVNQVESAVTSVTESYRKEAVLKSHTILLNHGVHRYRFQVTLFRDEQISMCAEEVIVKLKFETNKSPKEIRQLTSEAGFTITMGQFYGLLVKGLQGDNGIQIELSQQGETEIQLKYIWSIACELEEGVPSIPREFTLTLSNLPLSEVARMGAMMQDFTFAQKKDEQRLNALESAANSLVTKDELKEYSLAIDDGLTTLFKQYISKQEYSTNSKEIEKAICENTASLDKRLLVLQKQLDEATGLLALYPSFQKTIELRLTETEQSIEDVETKLVNRIETIQKESQKLETQLKALVSVVETQLKTYAEAQLKASTQPKAAEAQVKVG